jgi:hypothetical protein
MALTHNCGMQIEAIRHDFVIASAVGFFSRPTGEHERLLRRQTNDSMLSKNVLFTSLIHSCMLMSSGP